MEELTYKSMFSKIFFETIKNLNNRSDDEILTIKREFQQFVEGKTSTVRMGIQSKISLFLDCVRRKIEYLSEGKVKDFLSNKDRYMFFSKVVEALGLIYYQSVKKNRGINYPDKDSLERIIGSFVNNTPKANENFANFLFPEDKKLSLKAISELSAFICLLTIIFNADIEAIENVVLQELRRHVKIYVNNQTFIREINNCSFAKYVVIDGESYNFSEILNKFCLLMDIDDRHFVLGKLIFILLYFTECKAPTEGAKDYYVQWINNIQDEILNIANGYSKYLWIRYRRLPGVDLSAEQLNGYTIDNLYVFPNITAIDNNEKLFDGFFDKKSQKRMRRVIVSDHGAGKTSLLNTIISMAAINSDYAIRGMKISNYFTNYYKDVKNNLGFETNDVFPLVISCKKFDSFLNNHNDKKMTLVDFAYYLIISYNEELNIIGERNKGWYEKWISNFTFEQFQTLLHGAVEDDRLLLLIDDSEVIKNKEEFDLLFNEFLMKYGSNCDIIATASDPDYLPHSIVQMKNGFDIFNIGNLNNSQAKDVCARYYVYFKNPQKMQDQKQNVIDIYELNIDEIDKKENEFLDFIVNESIESNLLKHTIKDGCNNIFLNPLLLSKAAQTTAIKNNEFEINNLDNESLFEVLPVISQDINTSELLSLLIPKRLFDMIYNVSGQNGSNLNILKKFQRQLNKYLYLIKNQEVQKTIDVCNKLLKLCIDKGEI